MRTYRRWMAVPAAVLVLAAGCGRFQDAEGPGSGGGIAHSTGAGDLLLQVRVAGGFVPPTYALSALPTFSLYGDGTVIVVGPQIMIYPAPALPPLMSQRVTETGIQKLLEAARDAGAFRDATYDDFCGVADVGTTTIVTNVDDVRHEVSAYALGFDGCTDDPAARTKLAAFVGSLPSLTGLETGVDTVGPMGPYAFSSLAVIVEAYANFEDPSLQQQEVAWPVSTPLATFGEQVEGLPDLRCGVVTGADLEVLRPLLDDANELTPWTSEGDKYRLTLRPLLPDESGCPTLQ